MFAAGSFTLTGGNLLDPSVDTVKAVLNTSSCVTDPGLPAVVATPVDNAVASTKWRVSNGGTMTWRPAVSVIKMYSDRDCTQRVATTGGSVICMGTGD